MGLAPGYLRPVSRSLKCSQATVPETSQSKRTRMDDRTSTVLEIFQRLLTSDMRLSKCLLTSLLAFTALAAKKPATSKFEQFHAQAQSATPLEIDDAIYDQLTAAPRDYSVAVLLTALEPKVHCQLCRDFAPEWTIVAKSWQKGDKKGEGRMLFTTLDFSQGRGAFQKVRFSSAFRRSSYADTWLSCNCKRHPSYFFSGQQQARMQNLMASLYDLTLEAASQLSRSTIGSAATSLAVRILLFSDPSTIRAS